MKLATICLFLLAIGQSLAQCPEHDACAGALPISVDTPYTFCNDNCNAEEDGNPWQGVNFCASQELDFWLILTVDSGQIFTFKYYNDYAHPTNPEFYGAQIFLYEADDCQDVATWGNLVFGFPCGSDPNPTDQEIVYSHYLDPGTYYIQVDGYNWATGCGEFCAMDELWLNLNIEEIEAQRKTAIENFINSGFTILGQRVR